MQQTINLILDLDDVLIHNPTSGSSEENDFFNKMIYSIADSFGYTYTVPAYFSEFMRYVNTYYNISFFSSGNIKRNKSVINDIWMKVFNENTPNNIIILSGTDTIYAEDNDDIQPIIKYKGEKKPIMWFGNKKKDITKIGELHNTILVDDDRSWILKDQVKNFLYVNGSSFWKMKSFITY